MDREKQTAHLNRLFAQNRELVLEAFNGADGFTDLTPYGIEEITRRPARHMFYTCRQLAREGLLVRVDGINGFETYRLVQK